MSIAIVTLIRKVVGSPALWLVDDFVYLYIYQNTGSISIGVISLTKTS